MVQLIKKPTHEIITKDGEVKILLDITLNINSNGRPVVSESLQEEEEKTQWAIPSFKSSDKIKFGKTV